MPNPFRARAAEPSRCPRRPPRRGRRRLAALLLAAASARGAAAQLDRIVYDGSVAMNNVLWEEGDPAPADPTLLQVVRTAEDLYHLLSSVSGGVHLSWDGTGGTLGGILEATDPQSPACPGWGDGFAADPYAYLCAASDGDDSIGGAWASGVAESTHDPFREWQAGALAQSLADLWGEAADLLNADGTDTSDLVPRTTEGCFSGGAPNYRWLVGEDGDEGFGRDLRAPDCTDNPGRVTSALYACTADVEANSTVPSHAFALLVDGGSFNGRTVAAIGLDRALAIWWRAQSEHLGPATDFAAFADALEAACAELVAESAVVWTASVASPTPVDSGLEITAAHCTELGDAIDAVELRASPGHCGFEPLLDPAAAPAFCASGGAAAPLSGGNTFESGLGAWTVGRRSVVKPSTFDTANWTVVGGLPDGRAGSAAFVADHRRLGDCGTDVEAGVLYLQSPAFVVPPASTLELAFDHWLATEHGLDGGNLKVSVDGGGFVLVPASAIAWNPYNDVLDPGSNDPLAAEAAFTGTDEGSAGGGWGTTLVRLGALAPPGSSVRFRFELGLDGCDGRLGWYVDDVEAAACGNCGNGLLDAGEACDDGDFSPGDGCSVSCQVEEGWQCTLPVPPVPDVERVGNGGFEAGHAVWTEDPAGDLICNSCGPGASEGDWLAWLGGAPDTWRLEQTVTVPSGAGTLRFDLRVGACANGTDALRAFLGGTELFSTGTCAPTPAFQGREVALGGLADGSSRLLRFEAVTTGDTNFYLDEVSILDPGEPGVPSVCTSPSSLLFEDDFESGNGCAWSDRVPSSLCP